MIWNYSILLIVIVKDTVCVYVTLSVCLFVCLSVCMYMYGMTSVLSIWEYWDIPSFPGVNPVHFPVRKDKQKLFVFIDTGAYDKMLKLVEVHSSTDS